MKFPHLFHRDPDWQYRGVHIYYQCRCGARRVRQAHANWDGPAELGWPPLRDRHGVPVTDSGWRKMVPASTRKDGEHGD